MSDGAKNTPDATLHRFAEMAGRLAGLDDAQIPGLEELLRIVWQDGFDAARFALPVDEKEDRRG